MSENGHERRRDELAAYLLGALEPGEAAELERHLAGCEECRTELEWLRPAVQLLPESVQRVEAPPQLRGRLMEQVRSEAESAARRRSRGASLERRRLEPAPGRRPGRARARRRGGRRLRDRQRRLGRRPTRPRSSPATRRAWSPRWSATAARAPCT